MMVFFSARSKLKKKDIKKLPKFSEIINYQENVTWTIYNIQFVIRKYLEIENIRVREL